MTDPRRPLAARLIGWATGVIVLALALRTASHLAHQAIDAARSVPLWDESAQGFVAVQIADALRHGRVIELLALINAQVVWPPLHALLLAPLVLIHGPAFVNGALLSTLALAGTAFLAFVAGLRLSREHGALAGLIAAIAWLTAPLAQGFGMLGMLESPGACLLLLALVCRLRALWHPHARGAWVTAGLSSAALVLFKYNYGLMWLGALAIFEWTERTDAERRTARAALTTWWARGGWRRPVPLIVAAWVLLLAIILVTGGVAIHPFEVPISIRSPGNPAYGLFVFVVGAAAIAYARDRAAWSARWRRVPPGYRAMLAWLVVPLLVWFLIPVPNRVRALVEFSLNRTSGPAPFSLAGLTYYPRALLESYAAAPWAGALALVALLVPPRGRAHGPATRGARLVWIAALTGLIATSAHRYHDPRFLFTTAPLVWLNLGRVVADGIALLSRRASRAAAAVAALALVALAVWGWRAPAPTERADATRDAYRSDPALLVPVDAVLDLALTQTRDVALLGTSNALSPALLAWRARQRGLPATASMPPPRPVTPAVLEPYGSVAAAAEARMSAGALTIVALPVAGSALDAMSGGEVRADSAVAARLRFDARLQSRYDSTFAAAGVRVEAYRRPGLTMP